MQRMYLDGFSVKTVIKVNIIPLHSALLYYVAFGMLYVEQYFSILYDVQISRTFEILKEKSLHESSCLA